MGKYNLRDGTHVRLVGTDMLKLAEDTTEEQRVKFINEFNETERNYNPNPVLLPDDFGKKEVDYKFYGHTSRPSGGLTECKNCGEMVRLKKTYVNKSDDKDFVERCGHCDEFEKEA